MRFIYCFFLFLSFLAPRLYGQQFLKIKGKKAIISKGSLELKKGENYLILLVGKDSETSRPLKKKSIIKIIKIKKNKALVQVLRGGVFLDGMIKKIKLLTSLPGRGQKRPEAVHGQQSGSRPKQHSALFGLNFGKADILVANDLDLGFEFDSMIGLNLGYRYHWLPKITVRGNFVYSKGSASFVNAINNYSFDTKYSHLSLGASYHFLKNYFGFLEYGKSSMDLEETANTISPITLGGSSIILGAGYQRKITEAFMFVGEFSLQKSSWTDDSNQTEKSSQTLMFLSAQVSYAF